MDDSWTDIDYSSKWLPTDDQLRQSLQRLTFRPRQVDAEPITRLVDLFDRMLTNGGAYVAMFDIGGADDVAAWHLSRRRVDYELGKCLLRSEEFAAALPQVTEPGLMGEIGLERSSPLILDGELARWIQWGGAYTFSNEMPGSQAKAMGMAFCASLFGDRYDDVDVDRTAAPWSRWFNGIVWDSTWVITDRRYRRVTVLCTTDVD